MRSRPKAFDEVPAPASEPAEKPDIYYLVFDRYQRDDYLKKIYDFDNSSFLDELQKRGFVIVDEAYSNYQRTAHSVVSSLNFDYLDKLETPETKGSPDWYPLFEMFQDFRIGRFLKSLGYKLHFYGTWWEPTRRIAIADQNHTFYEVPEMARVIYEYSLLVDICAVDRIAADGPALLAMPALTIDVRGSSRRRRDGRTAIPFRAFSGAASALRDA